MAPWTTFKWSDRPQEVINITCMFIGPDKKEWAKRNLIWRAVWGQLHTGHARVSCLINVLGVNFGEGCEALGCLCRVVRAQGSSFIKGPQRNMHLLTNRASKSRQILMFVCLQKDARQCLTPQSSTVLIVLVIDQHQLLTSTMRTVKLLVSQHCLASFWRQTNFRISLNLATWLETNTIISQD